MSASFLVDLANTCTMLPSITSPPLLSGGSVAVGSGTIIGQSVNLINGQGFTNLFAAGVTLSGQLRLQVQVADADVSGQYTDPTSGLPVFPTSFSSGGILWINSGGTGQGVLGAQTSGQSILSGFLTGAGFIRNGTFGRVNVLTETSAQFAGALTVGFIEHTKTTGSGAGYSLSPTSGTVNV